jgi:hypothetical protein
MIHRGLVDYTRKSSFYINRSFLEAFNDAIRFETLEKGRQPRAWEWTLVKGVWCALNETVGTAGSNSRWI